MNASNHPPITPGKPDLRLIVCPPESPSSRLKAKRTGRTIAAADAARLLALLAENEREAAELGEAADAEELLRRARWCLAEENHYRGVRTFHETHRRVAFTKETLVRLDAFADRFKLTGKPHDRRDAALTRLLDLAEGPGRVKR